MIGSLALICEAGMKATGVITAWTGDDFIFVIVISMFCSTKSLSWRWGMIKVRHNGIMIWICILDYWPFVRGIHHWWLVDSLTWMPLTRASNADLWCFLRWYSQPGPICHLLLRVSSDYAQLITGQVTEVTCPVIGRAQPQLTRSKRQKMGPEQTFEEIVKVLMIWDYMMHDAHVTSMLFYNMYYWYLWWRLLIS